jgi:hypothetical protein
MLVTACGGHSSPGGPGASVSGSGGQGSNSSAGPGTETPAAGRRSATTGGALFGGNAALASQEGNLGRRLAIIRAYYRVGEPFPTQQDQQLMVAGSTLLVSFGTGGASYASIAAGSHDAAIMAFLRSVNQAAFRFHLGAIYVSFAHEPDSPRHRWFGSPAQFVQAWDHIHQLAESAHVDWSQGGRLHWVLILIHSSFTNGMANWFWPGAGEVDIVGADGYNSYACKAAKRGVDISHAGNDAVTPASIFDPAILFAHAHGGLSVFISEWGSDLSPAGAQSAFIRQMQAYVERNREIGAVMYWDSGFSCNYRVNGNPLAIAALAEMGHAAALQGRVAAAAG